MELITTSCICFLARPSRSQSVFARLNEHRGRPGFSSKNRHTTQFCLQGKLVQNDWGSAVPDVELHYVTARNVQLMFQVNEVWGEGRGLAVCEMLRNDDGLSLVSGAYRRPEPPLSEFTGYQQKIRSTSCWDNHDECIEGFHLAASLQLCIVLACAGASVSAGLELFWRSRFCAL